MHPPIFVREPSAEERARLEAALRASDAFTVRRAQIVLLSADGHRPREIARGLRCAVHTIRTQSTIRLREALTPRRGAAQGDDMADLQAAIADDDALDDELQDRLLLGQRRLVQAAADAAADRRQVRPRRFGSQPLLA